MPGLKAIIGADSRPMQQEFARSSAAAVVWSRGIRGAMQSAFDIGSARRPSTILNKREVLSQAEEYANFWQKALLDKDVEAASRSNRARQLLRQRAERREQAKSGGHGGGSFHSAMSELLVVGRELMNGNFSRLPTSLSILIQRFGLLKLVLHPVTLALAGIAAGAYIFHRRVVSLTESLNTMVTRVFSAEHVPKYLAKANEIAQVQKNITDEILRQAEAYDSVNEAADRLATITKEQFDFERNKIGIQKANALAAATSEEKRRAIEKRFGQQELALNKQERDQEIANMKARKAALEQESKTKLAQADTLLKTTGIKGEKAEEQNAENLKKANEAAEEYLKATPFGDKDERAHSAEKDRKILADKRAKKENSAMAGPMAFSATDQAVMDAAQERLNAHQKSKADYNKFLDEGDQRSRARKRVEDLKKEGEDAATAAAALGDEKHGRIADQITANKKTDEHEAELERLRHLKQLKQSGQMGLNELQRVGAFAGPGNVRLIDVNISMDRKLGQIVAALKTKRPSSGMDRRGLTGVGF